MNTITPEKSRKICESASFLANGKFSVRIAWIESRNRQKLPEWKKWKKLEKWKPEVSNERPNRSRFTVF
jgi:hypothetical protein